MTPTTKTTIKHIAFLITFLTLALFFTVGCGDDAPPACAATVSTVVPVCQNAFEAVCINAVDTDARHNTQVVGCMVGPEECVESCVFWDSSKGPRR